MRTCIYHSSFCIKMLYYQPRLWCWWLMRAMVLLKIFIMDQVRYIGNHLRGIVLTDWCAHVCVNVQVAKDTKNLIMLMFQSAEAIDEMKDTAGADPSFTKQFLTDTTRSLKSCVLNLIKACKVVYPSNKTHHRNTNPTPPITQQQYWSYHVRIGLSIRMMMNWGLCWIMRARKWVKY